MKPDRLPIRTFMEIYSSHLHTQFFLSSYPEDHQSIPDDAKIDAIYKSGTREIQIEHTSVDLIVSGKRNKRSLDPSFIAIEECLCNADLPAHQGLYINIPLDAAKDVARVKKCLPELISKVSNYIINTKADEWDKYPRKPDSISANGINFGIQPDSLKRGKVRPAWVASEENFLQADQLETTIDSKITSKLTKLANYAKLQCTSQISVLIVETNDVAAKSFHDFAGVFAKIVNRHETKCDEIWGIHGNSEPTLLWCKDFDLGVTTCIYSENLSNRTYYEIERQRMYDWIKLRKAWISQKIPHTQKS